MGTGTKDNWLRCTGSPEVPLSSTPTCVLALTRDYEVGVAFVSLEHESLESFAHPRGREARLLTKPFAYGEQKQVIHRDLGVLREVPDDQVHGDRDAKGERRDPIVLPRSPWSPARLLLLDDGPGHGRSVPHSF